MGSTLSAIKSKIRTETEMEDTSYLTEAELTNYINDGIREAQRRILNLNEDYFLANTSIALVAGQDTLSLPADIFANKIRRLYYVNGSEYYKINRILDLDKTLYISSNDDYSYVLTNTSTGGVKIKIYPASRETSASNVTIWYIRDAKVLSSASDQCDIPEFESLVEWYAKVKCYEKEGTADMIANAKERFEQEVYILESTLKNMVPSDDNEIILGDEIYSDFYNNYSIGERG